MYPIGKKKSSRSAKETSFTIGTFITQITLNYGIQFY